MARWDGKNAMGTEDGARWGEGGRYSGIDIHVLVLDWWMNGVANRVKGMR